MSSDSIQMAPVTSSNVAAIGHDPAKNELHVEFKNGGRYVYTGVDTGKHAALMAAKSIGSHIAVHIKGSHPSRKVGA